MKGPPMARRGWDTNPFRGGKFLGKRIPLLAGLLCLAFEKLIDYVEPPEDEGVERGKTARDAMKFRKRRRKSRSASAYEALEEAKRLVKVYRDARYGTDPQKWAEACRECEVSVRTAENLLMLARLWAGWPELFRVFSCLGRTKLYHIARLPAVVLESMRPRMKVEVEEGRTVELREMTDREMLRWLRKVAPVAQRKRVTGLRGMVTRCLEMATKEGTLESMGRVPLRETARKTQELFGVLARAAKTTA